MKANFPTAWGYIHASSTKCTARTWNVGIFYTLKICRFGKLTYKLWLSQKLTVRLIINKTQFGGLCGIFLLSSNLSFFGKHFFYHFGNWKVSVVFWGKITWRNIWLHLFLKMSVLGGLRWGLLFIEEAVEISK